MCGNKGGDVENDLIAKIRNNPRFNENVHSVLIDVIKNEFSPQQLSLIGDDPHVSDSLVRGMLDSMITAQATDTVAPKDRKQEAEELVRKSLGFLKRRFDTELNVA
jgi:hypothetical protein